MEVFLHQIAECPHLLGLSIYCWFKNAEGSCAILDGIDSSDNRAYVRAQTSSETIFPYTDSLVVVNGRKSRDGNLQISSIDPIKEGTELWSALMDGSMRKLLVAQSDRNIKVNRSHTVQQDGNVFIAEYIYMY